MTLSSTEAEYIALSETAKEVLFISRLLNDLDQDLNKPAVIFEDNQSCIRLVQDEKSCKRTKHIDTKFHFVRELYRSGDITLKYCPTSDMPADLLTKPLDCVKMKHLAKVIGMV